MKYGIPDSVLNEINSVFFQSKKVEKLVLFGSRAKGNFKTGSDIDLAVFGSDLNFSDYLQLSIKLDELELLHKIDLLRFETIENVDLKNHINRVGIELYNRKVPA